MKTVQLPFYARLALVIISILCFGYLAYVGKQILAPLIIAFLFSILLYPMAAFLEKRFRFPRAAASFVSLLLLVAGVMLIIYFIGAEISALTNDLPLLKQQVANSGSDLQQWVKSRFNMNISKQMSYVHKATENLLSSSGAVIGKTILSVSSMLLFLVFIAIYIFFMLFHRRLLMHFLVELFHKENSSMVYEIVEHIQYIIKKYIVGLFFQMCIVAALTSITLLIAGVKYAILLGIIAGVFNVIPYVGIFSALALAALITFTTATAGKVLLVAIVFICVHLIDSNYIMPRIVGSKVKINALVVVLGVVLGEMIWGISGMFLSIPVIAILKIIADRIESLKPWGLLLGDEDSEEDNPSQPRKVLKDEQPVPQVVKEK
jgi:predicted PurR-regulated permease PerM